MLSKNKIKFIQSLNRKKTREKEGVFLVEGNKLVLEAIASPFRVRLLIGTAEFFESHQLSSNVADELIECTSDEIRRASLQQAPQQAIAVVEMPSFQLKLNQLNKEFSLALDFIQDPGNLGTIIRIADWFGIRNLICSTNTADCFNPKVIQSSMGAIFRVQVHYLDLEKLLNEAKQSQLPVYGTFLEGENIYTSKLTSHGILILGNEGNGISPEVEKLVQQKLHIPSFALGTEGSESLNVASAASICCSEFKRRTC
ncbi:RNA methyltransferase [uncultured Sunxiuqinia sp.]|uniref:TrmH family RNA methyltransferase n=1 Tax=uncultured Sunxiuqinia sp. TaxID=1573825 RepID=UPI0026036BBE|nr:RNA methyltransferase [uncultured Sunxiuqinia sp.]